MKIPSLFKKELKKENLGIKAFGGSTMIYNKSDKYSFVCGLNKYGELGIGNKTNFNTF